MDGKCHKCGTLLPEEAMFCFKCGTMQKRSTSSTARNRVCQLVVKNSGKNNQRWEATTEDGVIAMSKEWNILSGSAYLTNPKMDIKRVIGEMKQANLSLAGSLAEEGWQILYTDNDGQVLLLQRTIMSN